MTAQPARPATTPAYYLGRPAGWWITVIAGRRRRSGPASPPRQPICKQTR